MRWNTPKIITEWITLIREKGLKQFIKEKGWKILALIFAFYLVRDTILYIILPYLIIHNMISCQ